MERPCVRKKERRRLLLCYSIFSARALDIVLFLFNVI